MGGHNLPYRSPIWVGMGDNKFFRVDARGPAGPSRLSGLSRLFGLAPLIGLPWLCGRPSLVMRRSVDLTPRRRLVYDAAPVSILSCTQRRRNATWLVMR